MSNPFLPLMAEVLEVNEETPTIKTLVLNPEKEIKFRAGQFVQLGIPGVGEAPFTPSSSQFKTDTLDITILKAGFLTEKLHGVKQGDTVTVRGPFGEGYPVEKFFGKEVLVVGGGVGLAPLRSFLYSAFHQIDKYKKVSIKYGARNPEELCYRNLYEDWKNIKKVNVDVTIDVPAKGWNGRVGLVTTLLDDIDVDLNNSYVVSCGPEIMLKFVTYKLLDKGFKPNQIYLSMNRNMSCGMGICGKCNVGKYYLCKDGPDMCYEDVKDVPDVFS